MIKAVIVDDEPPSLRKLRKQLLASGMVEVTGAFLKPADALGFLCENQADAVFLDVEMPDMDGIELANRILDLQGNISLVFVTAYNQYAVEAFRLNALDYLLKPVSTDRLKETLNRIVSGKVTPTNSMELRVRCFGRFQVLFGTEEIKFRTEKAEMLMAFLIDCGGNYISRNKIIDSLWEDFDGDRAIMHFNTTLHNVKKALVHFGVQVEIQYEKGNYRLETKALDCDYLKFLDFKKTTSNACVSTIRSYENIVSLYAGEYLSGWNLDWAGGRRLMLEEQLFEYLLDIAQYYRETGKYKQEIKWLKYGLPHEPLHREMNYRLIEALLLSHEQALATKYFELYRNGLRKRLETEPDTKFQMLLNLK